MKTLPLLYCLLLTTLAVAQPRTAPQPNRPATAQTVITSPATEQLKALLKAYQQFQEQELPRRGSSRMSTPLGSFSEADHIRRGASYENLLKQVTAIDTRSLTADERITAELLRFVFQNEVEQVRYKSYLNPILVDYGFHIGFVGNASAAPATVAEYENYLDRLKDFPRYVRQHTDLMRKGLTLGIAQPAVILEGYETTYEPHIVDQPEKSQFWRPFTRMPATFPYAERNRLLAEGRRAIMDSVVAGFRAVKTFFDTEYLPKAPTKIGVSNWPNGLDYYEQRVRYFTTLPMTARQVHELGLKEVARIRTEMDSVMRKTGFKGSFAEFLAFLRTDPQFYPKTAKDLLKEAAYIAKQAEAQLPAFFGKLPRQPFGVAPVPDYLAPKYTAGRYSGSSIKSRNPGYYWVNTYDLKSRTLYTLEALTLHEAVPGHHLQSALTQELTNLPTFRQNLYVNAYGEGWALYTEWLGREMGFYKDPYSDFGRLTYEMWRACRLVVDTGIHAFGWSRDQAMKYLQDNTALSLLECRTETDRYISWPGQALSYKIGELTIKELRRKAEAELGSAFDIRDFHDQLLAQGTVTMPVLETLVDDFIRQKKSSRTPEVNSGK
ncbi:DUF885 domain-containing protein [Nibrella saemangeumensis]|uniref:DUF885 domain-containing protein n=1 Tax=Nibrella saemangeumensis TaxID=1084526 RepID=A0ABP8MJY1_9BACT